LLVHYFCLIIVNWCVFVVQRIEDLYKSFDAEQVNLGATKDQKWNESSVKPSWMD